MEMAGRILTVMLLSENDREIVYQDFQKASDNKTTILISHRLGSVKLADQILVLNHGKIVESGSHEKLMENHQLYYEMYESQRSWYQ